MRARRGAPLPGPSASAGAQPAPDRKFRNSFATAAGLTTLSDGSVAGATRQVPAGHARSRRSRSGPERGRHLAPAVRRHVRPGHEVEQRQAFQAAYALLAIPYLCFPGHRAVASPAEAVPKRRLPAHVGVPVEWRQCPTVTDASAPGARLLEEEGGPLIPRSDAGTTASRRPLGGWSPAPGSQRQQRGRRA
jgi:hypothetical protein